MPKQSAKAEFNTFVQGLITEASPLNFPPNASLDEENFELNRTGTRFRRLGMDYEPGFVQNFALTSQSILDANPPSTYKWLNVGGDSTKNFLVVQCGQVLGFLDLSIEPLSGQFVNTAGLSIFPNNVKFSFTSVDGKLIVAAGAGSVAIIEFSAGLFLVGYGKLQTRDVWGVEVTDVGSYEGDNSFRNGFSPLHKYNLTNQSWGIPRKNSLNILVDPAEQYYNDLGVYPSNSEVVWTGLQFQAVQPSQTPFERMYTNLYQESLGSELKTAKGYYIIDVLNRGFDRETKFTANRAKYTQITPSSVDLPNDVTPGGASVLGEFAGRVFYSGFSGQVVNGDKRSPNLSNFVFFSQLVKNTPDIVKCYQEGDPTSRDSSDVVDTDGGFIRISGMNKAIAMVNMATHLVIIADNGVWAIQGGSDFGFSATNFKVDRLSTFGSISASSVVEFSGKTMYWGADGIYLIQKDQFGSLVVNSVTETTIQTFYESIDNVSKMGAVGCYDSIGKKIRWLYKSGTPFTSTSEQRELIFDLVINAFYKHKINNSQTNNVEVFSLFSSVQFRNNDGTEEVVVDTDPVLVVSDPVVIPDPSLRTALQSTRYLIMDKSQAFPSFTFSYYRDENFRDWDSLGVGVDAKAFMITGQLVGGDSSIPKQVPYLTMHMFRTEEGVDSNLVPLKQSSCKVRGQWEWANSANSNKWGPLQEVYRYRKAYLATSPTDLYDTGFQLVTSKTKLRGRGKAFSLYLETSPEKDCKIVGWNLAVNANQIT